MQFFKKNILNIFFIYKIFCFLDDCKSTPPPTLEPSGLALSPPPGDTPQDPPTLRPMTADPKTTSACPSEALKLSSERQNAEAEADVALQNTAQDSPPILLPSEGKLLNGVSATQSLTQPISGGVGRRTSVLFRKAKNGAKLQRERDNQLQNGSSGESKAPPLSLPCSNNLTPITTTVMPLTTNSETTAQTLQPSTPPPVLSPANQRDRSLSASPEREQKTPPRFVDSGKAYFS